MTKSSLEQQVVAALTADPPPSPADLLTLIAETEAGIDAADAAAEAARAAFLDPVASPDVNKARAAGENAITKRGYRDRDSAGKSGGRIRPFFAFMRSARPLGSVAGQSNSREPAAALLHGAAGNLPIW